VKHLTPFIQHPVAYQDATIIVADELVHKLNQDEAKDQLQTGDFSIVEGKTRSRSPFN